MHDNKLARCTETQEYWKERIKSRSMTRSIAYRELWLAVVVVVVVVHRVWLLLRLFRSLASFFLFFFFSIEVTTWEPFFSHLFSCYSPHVALVLLILCIYIHWRNIGVLYTQNWDRAQNTLHVFWREKKWRFSFNGYAI